MRTPTRRTWAITFFATLCVATTAGAASRPCDALHERVDPIGTVVRTLIPSAGVAASAVALETARISVSSTGTQGNGLSDEADISDYGRFVAFVSEATNLVPGDTNGFPDVFVRDRRSGITTRVSVATNGAQANEESDEPAISRGRPIHRLPLFCKQSGGERHQRRRRRVPPRPPYRDHDSGQRVDRGRPSQRFQLQSGDQCRRHRCCFLLRRHRPGSR